ncbi:hypothetical protein UFOVP328_202 [uncultured Caudovirales phage]|uniref:Uncharacterized protein n=1 Tax=uncultured Caudovirales phage TaxID=2100421 RepID=A0A6J5M1W3_9CAUD|nr:hypothetical protein UFOVP328_202 [uncultured Caudovirales phage]
MIRIDEIYNHTFWPWLGKNVPGTRMFFCDPPGRTDPDALFNLGCDDIIETDYVFFHDQEPVWMDLHAPLFDDVIRRNLDMTNARGHVIVSERGQYVDEMCQRYGWKPHYYFYHGWACQDWFRGYDKAFLIPRARDRAPTQTFMSPNRIVAGKRDHRVLFLYNVFKNGLEHNHISAPRICQYENVDISSIAQKYTNVYHDITNVFDCADLPRLFEGEDQQEMASCWLTNFKEAQDSLVYVPTETVYFGHRQHITEKTFKAIALEMPFVLVAPAHSLEYMREYGFQTFADVFDESYDQETDDIKRVEKVIKLLKDLDNLTVKERQQIHQACVPIVEHNYHHFYQGGFTDVLWPELLNMLKGLTS